MAHVIAIVEEIKLKGDYRDNIPGIMVTCSKCQHQVEVYGTRNKSAWRGAVMLREQCPNKEHNYYDLKLFSKE